MEAPIRHLKVGIWVAPTSQPALRVRILPERRFIEVRRIYPAIRIINARNRRWMVTDSPIPIWRHARKSTLILEGLFKDMYVPTMPWKELPRKMYLEKSRFSLR